MSPDSSPVRVEAKVDGTEALNKTVENTSSGLSRVFSACLAKREADNEAYRIRALQQANTDKELIAFGAAVFEPKTGGVNRVLQPEQIAQLLLEDRQERAPKNITACLNHAASALEEAPAEESHDQTLDADFLDAWLDGAKRVNSEYLQRVWGRILATNVREENAISLRTIMSLAQVSAQETELFTRFLQYRLDDMIVLPDIFPSGGIDGLVYGDVLSLTDAGFFIPEKGVGYTCGEQESETLHIFWGNSMLVKIETTPTCNKFSLCGRPLSTMGKEVSLIANPKPLNEEILQYFYWVLSELFPKKIKGIYAHEIIEHLGSRKIRCSEHPLFTYTPPIR